MLSVSTQLAVGDDLSTFKRMIQSVNFADEIVVYNMGISDQDFFSLCQKLKLRVVNLAKIPKVVEVIRTNQVKDAKHDWVLIMDFDEEITGELAKEIIKVTSAPPRFGGYFVNRRNFSLSYPLRHGGFGNDMIPRLFYKPKFLVWPAEIHGMPSVEGGFGQLEGLMNHYKDASLSQMITKTNRYSDVEAKQFYEGGIPKVTVLTIFRKTIMEFVRRYLIKLGFLDGVIGVIQSIYQSYSVFLTYAKLYELQTTKKL